MWNPYEPDSTGEPKGSEGGVVVADEEYSDGARITLERDCPSGVPFAITCGVYGLMFHTRFLGDDGTEARAQYEQMKTDLALIVDQMAESSEDLPDSVAEAVAEFIQVKYP